MTTPPSIVYECPLCGQGGLLRVSFKSIPRRSGVVCSECDRAWPASVMVGCEGYVDLYEELARLGLREDRLELEQLENGVAWEDIDHRYQSILLRKMGSSA